MHPRNILQPYQCAVPVLVRFVFLSSYTDDLLRDSLVGAGLRVIHEHFGNLSTKEANENLAVTSIILLHIGIPIVTTRTVKAMGKDRPNLADFCSKVARIIMKLSSHTYFASGNMIHYNNLIRHLEVPFERFCSDVCFEGKDFEEEGDLPEQVSRDLG